MTLRSYAMTFNGSAQQLSSLLTAGVLDVPVYCVDIQADPANSNPIYVGGSDVSASVGIRIPVPLDSIPEPPYRIGDAADADMRLGDVYVLGTNGEKARILIFA